MKRLSSVIPATGAPATGGAPRLPPPARDCDRCQGRGAFRLDVELDDPEWGKMVFCECVQPSLRAFRYHEVGGPGVDDLDRDYSFDGFRTAGPGLLSIRDMVEGWAVDPHGWLVLVGPPGGGKTYLAATVARYRLRAGDDVCFAVVADLLDAMRRGYGDDGEWDFAETFARARDAMLLVLDDLGAQRATAWAAEKLLQLVNTRYSRKRPTLITANVGSDDMDPRLASRVFDVNRSTICTMPAGDFRRGRK